MTKLQSSLGYNKSLLAWKLYSVPSLLISQPVIRSPESLLQGDVRAAKGTDGGRCTEKAKGTEAETHTEMLIQNICFLIAIRSWGRTTQMWPNSWTTWPCFARTRASTRRWSTTTAAPWRSTSAGWAQMIPMWPKLKTTWWETSYRRHSSFYCAFFPFQTLRKHYCPYWFPCWFQGKHRQSVVLLWAESLICSVSLSSLSAGVFSI